jgi:hypothetical protein
MKEFDNLVNNSFEAERDIPFSEEAWEELSGKLDTLPSNSKNNWWWLLLLLPLLASFTWNWCLQREINDLKKDLLVQTSAVNKEKVSIVDTVIIHHYDTLIQTIVQERVIKEYFPYQQKLAELKAELEDYKNALSKPLKATEEADEGTISSINETPQLAPIVHRPYTSSLPINILQFNPTTIESPSEKVATNWKFQNYLEVSLLDVNLENVPYIDSLNQKGSTFGYALDFGFGFGYKNFQIRTSLGYENLSFFTPSAGTSLDTIDQQFSLQQIEIDQRSLRWRIGAKYTQPIFKRLNLSGSLDMMGYFNQRIQEYYAYSPIFVYLDPYTEHNIQRSSDLYFDNLLLQLELDYEFYDNKHLSIGWGRSYYSGDRPILTFDNTYHIGLKAFF